MGRKGRKEKIGTGRLERYFLSLARVILKLILASVVNRWPNDAIKIHHVLRRGWKEKGRDGRRTTEGNGIHFS